MTAKKYKTLRNMFILLGIVISFIMWLFLPDSFRNTSFFHVGTGEHGSKWGVLLVLILPLFSLCFRTGQWLQDSCWNYRILEIQIIPICRTVRKT